MSFDFLLDQVGEVSLLLPALPPQGHDGLVGGPDDQEVGGLVGVQVALGGQLVETGLQMCSSVLLESVVDLSHAGSGTSGKSLWFLDWRRNLRSRLGAWLEGVGEGED